MFNVDIYMKVRKNFNSSKWNIVFLQKETHVSAHIKKRERKEAVLRASQEYKKNVKQKK